MSTKLSAGDQLDYNFMLGIAAGWERAAAAALDAAVTFFRAGDDDDAQLMRATSRRFQEESARKRESLDKWQAERLKGK